MPAGVSMEVVIEDGRKLSRFSYGTRVLVDIYRSTSTMPILLKNGAEAIIPTETVEEARNIKNANPDYVTIGERLGFKVPGFDYGNSPSKIIDVDLTGKTVIFTSTNGTKVLKKITDGADVFISSFINVDATLRAIEGKGEVSVVTSNRPNGQADEDVIFAEYMMRRLKGENASLEDYIKRVRNSNGSRWLTVMGFRRDVEASLMANAVDFAVAYRNGKIVRY